MRKLVFLSLLMFSISVMKSQELNCLVTVNYNQVQGSNTQVFKTLENSLSEFVNQTKWTNKEVKAEERIDCAFTIIISSRDANTFKATLQVQSTRPVFGSTYASPILNLKDNDFNFKYNEFDPLIYNKNSFDSNLISTIVFYANIVLGADADTFKNKGGEVYLKEAQNVMLQAQQSGLASWQNVVGKQNRFLLIDNFLSPKLSAYRNTTYNYHRNGLDKLVTDKNIAKQTIEDAVISLESIYNKTVGNYLIRTFFDAKSDEIVNLYSDGPATRNQNKLIEVVRKLSPNNNSKWKDIK
ncbi:DUF4835 domain-containing protein [Polaribacter sp. SA4-12]|nr:DUF4835 domain-containing protein [Polaribacter sp. SA4-12]